MELSVFRALHREHDAAEGLLHGLREVSTDLKHYGRFELLCVRQGSQDGLRVEVTREIAEELLVRLLRDAKGRYDAARAGIMGLVAKEENAEAQRAQRSAEGEKDSRDSKDSKDGEKDLRDGKDKKDLKGNGEEEQAGTNTDGHGQTRTATDGKGRGEEAQAGRQHHNQEQVGPAGKKG